MLLLFAGGFFKFMMAQNRQAERDRYQASEDYKVNIESKKKIEELQIVLARIENNQLFDILKALNISVGSKSPP